MPHFFLPFYAFVAIVAASAGVAWLQYSWEGWAPASCVLASRCFCEGIGGGIIRQWANTYSNLAFVFVGLWLWGLARRDQAAAQGPPPNLMASHPAFSHLYAAIVVLLGFFSMFFHMSLTFAGQWFDLQAMYLITAFLVLYNLARSYRLSPRVFLLAYLGANAALGVLQVVRPGWRRQVFALLLLAVALTAALDRARRPSKARGGLFVGAAACLGLAALLWWLDINKILCDPTSWLQGHAVWHLLCALSTGLIFLYYRSERDPQRLSPSDEAQETPS